MWLAISYLCGSVPFALLLGKLKGVDIRKEGSGNVGATNVWRVLGRRWGVACFFMDMLKGFVPVLGAGLIMGWVGDESLGLGQAWQWLAVAMAAVLGHVYPLWLRFRGGKGVATGLGVLLGFWPILTVPGLAAWATWVAMILSLRYVSLASMVAAVSIPVYLVVLHRWRGAHESLWPMLMVTCIMAALVIVRHRSNLVRLFDGTEPKVGRS